MLAIAYLLAGAIAAVAGVAVLAGAGWALVAAGALLLALGVLEARGSKTGLDLELVGEVDRAQLSKGTR